MELVSRHMAREHLNRTTVEFSSAGTHASPNRPMDPSVAERLAALDIDSSGFSSRALRPNLLLDADLVLTAGSAHRSSILRDHPGVAARVFTLGQFAEASAHAPARLRSSDLVRSLGRNRRSTDPGWDVADPYRQPAEVVDAVTRHLDHLIATVVPRLV